VYDALLGYYKWGRDENNDTSQIVNALVGILRQHRFSEDDITKMKVGLLHVATSNMIPALFWFASYVLSRRDMVTELREARLAMLVKVSGCSLPSTLEHISSEKLLM
jgi:hypothetical protein